MRKILTAVSAIAALAGATTLASSAALPAVAQAGTSCKAWRLPTNTTLFQSNGWKMRLWYSNGSWHATASQGGSTQSGNVVFDSATASDIDFTVGWSNGATGVYQGFITKRGIVQGNTYDVFAPKNHASWHLQNLATCVRR